MNKKLILFSMMFASSLAMASATRIVPTDSFISADGTKTFSLPTSSQALVGASSTSVFSYLTTGSSYGGTNSTLAFTGINNTVVGNGAAAAMTSGHDNTIIGKGAAASDIGGNNYVAIGSGAGGTGLTSASGGIYIGEAAVVSDNTANNIVIGTGSTGSAGSVTIIGTSSIANGIGGVAIGQQSTAAGSSVAVGFKALAGADGQSIGALISTGGHASYVAGAASTAFVSATADSQISFGTPDFPLFDLYLGEGATAAASPTNVTIRPTAASGANVAGKNLTVIAGNGTGTGGSGSIIFQTSPVGASSSTANTLTTVGSISNAGAHVIGASGTTPTHSLNTATATTGAGVGTFTNLPTGFSGNPTGYISITINGVAHVIPYW